MGVSCCGGIVVRGVLWGLVVGCLVVVMSCVPGRVQCGGFVFMVVLSFLISKIKNNLMLTFHSTLLVCYVIVL